MTNSILYLFSNIFNFSYKATMNNRKGINTTRARMKDGSGNPFMQRSEIKDCSVPKPRDPGAAVTQRKLGHAQKKSLLRMSKGIVYFMF
jgi:hypothetical protein